MAEDEAPKLSVKPTGRILMDGAVYMGGNGDIKNDEEDTKFVDGVAIPDLRLGVKASYGKWKAKIDVGFGYGKVGLKDTYLEYDFNPANLIRVGYFVPQWGLNSETSSSMKQTYEEPTSNEFFYANPRLLAAMWVYDKDQVLCRNFSILGSSSNDTECHCYGQTRLGRTDSSRMATDAQRRRCAADWFILQLFVTDSL